MRATCALLGVLVAVGSARGAERPRWIEVHAMPRTEAERARIVALGFETKERADGGTEVFLPAGELASLEQTRVAHEIVHADLGAFYAARLAQAAGAKAAGAGARQAPAGGSMGGYFTWGEAVAEMDALVAAYPGLLAPRVSAGVTHEGRDIWVWKLSANVGADEAEPEVLLLALMHAREPESMMSLLWFTHEMLAGYGVDPTATYLLEHREIWIVPVLNPDGYVYNETTDPGGGGMWRKNRRDNGRNYGVDPNRNFSFEWAHDDSGSSRNASSDTYRGPSPLSEPETQAVRDLVLAHRPIVSVNTHTFGDHLVRPWGYVDEVCTDDAIFEDLSRVATRGTAYDVGNTWGTLGYLANGCHDDYMWGETTAKPRVYGVTPELGNADDGFWPAPERIDPLRREAYPMHQSFVWAAGSEPRLAAQAIDDAFPGGDGDGRPEPGETVRLVVTLVNHGLGASLGPLSATLVSDTCAIRVEDGSADYGVLASQVAADNSASPFVVRIGADAVPGELVRLRLVLSDAGGAYPALPVALLPGDPQVVFSDDFEGTLGAWTVAGFGREAAGAGRAGQALSESVGGAYGDDADATATPRATFDLSSFGHAWLLFDHRIDVDNDFDAGWIEARSGSGPWIPVVGETTDAGSGVGAQALDSPVYDGHLFTWTAERADLTAFTGPGASAVSFRFRFKSDGSIGYDGWHLDDVALVGFAAAPPVLSPNDPRPLLAARRGGDVVFTWTLPTVDAAHGRAESYVLYRSATVRADSGFAPLVSALAPGATDARAAAATVSYAYAVVGSNCAGSSPQPPP